MADRELSHRAAGEAEIIEAGEELDVYTVAAFRNLVCGLISQQARCKLIIDLQHTRFIDATGLGVLVGALRRTRADDGWLSVACTYEPILRQFRIVGLMELLDVHDTVEDALEARGIAGTGKAAQ